MPAVLPPLPSVTALPPAHIPRRLESRAGSSDQGQAAVPRKPAVIRNCFRGFLCLSPWEDAEWPRASGSSWGLGQACCPRGCLSLRSWYTPCTVSLLPARRASSRPVQASASSAGSAHGRINDTPLGFESSLSPQC